MDYKKKKDDSEERYIALIEENKHSMYKVAKAILHNNEDISDAMQETIIACYVGINKLHNQKYFKTWITRILINKCYDILKKSKSVVSIDTVEEQSDNYDFDEKIFVKDSFGSLDANYQLVMTLYYIDGFRTKEIAEILNLSENTVKTRLSRGRVRFKTAYLKTQLEGLSNV